MTAASSKAGREVEAMPQPDEPGDRRPLAPRDRLIVALDVPTLAEARAVVAATRGAVGMFKIGH
jgi:hypothetical protein